MDFHLSGVGFMLLFLTGLVAGFVDSIAGGGLISLPVLLSLGMPPQLALGTNKRQGSFGILSAAATFIRKGTVSLDESVHGIIFTFMGTRPGRPKMTRNLFFTLFGLGLGFYDGFFGPGTGSFWTGGLLIIMGMDMTKAAGTTRIMNFASNIVALSLFILGKNVLYSAGFCMAAGQVIGARAGSGLAIKRGASFIA